MHIEHGDDIGRLCGAGQHASYGTRFGCSVLCLAAAHRAWGGGGDLLDSMAPAEIGVSVAERRAKNRQSMAGGVYHDIGAHLVCLGPGQRLIQPAPLPARRVLLSQAERNRVCQAVIIGAAFLALVLAPVVFRAANMWLPGGEDRLDEPAGGHGRLRTHHRRPLCDRSQGS